MKTTYYFRSSSSTLSLLASTLLFTLLCAFLFTTFLPTSFILHLNAAVLDRFDSTFIYDDHRDGDAVYDLSLSFSHNTNKEPTPKYILFLLDTPPLAKIKHIFVKARNQRRPEILSSSMIMPLPEGWYLQNIYIRADFITFYRDDDPATKISPETTKPWTFTAVFCQDLANCVAGNVARNVYTYTETIKYPSFGTPSVQWLTQWKAIDQQSGEQNLFELVLTDTFSSPANLTQSDPIDFFDIKFVGYYSFRPVAITRPTIKNACFLNQIPVDVQLLGTDARQLRVYLTSSLSSDTSEDRVRQLILGKKHRVHFTCNDALLIQVDWRSGPYPYSVIRVGHQRVTSTLTYEHVLYEDFFFQQLTPFYSQYASVPPPPVIGTTSEWNPRLDLLTMSWVFNFTKKKSKYHKDTEWDSRQYLLPDTNFTISTIIDDTRFDLNNFAASNEKSTLAPTGHAGLFIFPEMSFENIGDYGPMLTYTDVYYEGNTGNPAATFEFLSPEHARPPGANLGELKALADATPFHRSSPLSPYGNFVTKPLDELRSYYPVRLFMLWHLPNVQFCTPYPLWASRIQLDSRIDGNYSRPDGSEMQSEVTQFHLTSYLNVSTTPWKVDPSLCSLSPSEQHRHMMQLETLSGIDASGMPISIRQKVDFHPFSSQTIAQQSNTRPFIASIQDLIHLSGEVDEIEYPMLSKLQKSIQSSKQHQRKKKSQAQNQQNPLHRQSPSYLDPTLTTASSKTQMFSENDIISTMPRGEYEASSLFQKAIKKTQEYQMPNGVKQYLQLVPPPQSTLLSHYQPRLDSTTNQHSTFDQSPDEREFGNNDSSYSTLISTLSDYFLPQENNRFQDSNDDDNLSFSEECDKSVDYPDHSLSTTLVGEALAWSRYYKSRGLQIVIRTNRCKWTDVNILFQDEHGPDPSYVVNKDNPLIFDEIVLSLPQGKYSFELSDNKDVKLQPPGDKQFNQKYQIPCTLLYSIEPVQNKVKTDISSCLKHNTMVTFDPNFNSIHVNNFPICDEMRKREYLHVLVISQLQVNCPSIYWGERSWNGRTPFYPIYNDDKVSVNEVSTSSSFFNSQQQSSLFPNQSYTSTSQTDFQSHDTGSSEDQSDISEDIMGKICHRYYQSSHTMESIACGELFDKLNQGKPRFMLSVSDKNEHSYLRPRFATLGLWSGLAPPKRPIQYVAIVLPILFAVLLTFVVALSLWRRYDDHLAAQRKDNIQIQTEQMDASTTGGRTRIQQLLADLHASEMDNYGDEENKHPEIVEQKIVQEEEEDDQEILTDQIDPRLSRYAAIAAAKALVQKQREKQEQEKAKLNQDVDEFDEE